MRVLLLIVSFLFGLSLARSLASAQPKDDLALKRGAITTQTYRSALSETVQQYAVYLPKDYDGRKKYPLMIVLHGGSSNGNLFLGVVLGNNMDWKKYPEHLNDVFTPRIFPDWIVIAPDGYGQIIWRWMGEQDIIDVVTDARKNFSIDENRIALVGLSNGGMGAHMVGLRHAHLFSSVVAIAGAPSWLMYTGGKPSPEERLAMQRISAFDLAENAMNTDYRIFHGRTDPGPMKPQFLQAYAQRLKEKNVPHRFTWFDAGHDILYMSFRQGKLFESLRAVTRKQRPEHVIVVSGDYRAAKQHWLSLTGIENYPEIGRAEGKVQKKTLKLQTQKVDALSIQINALPETLIQANDATIEIDGQTVYQGALKSLDPGKELSLLRNGKTWKIGKSSTLKTPATAGPITDAYYGAMLHVYGTGNAEDTEALKQAAKKGSKGWPLWLWNYSQRVIADHELTPELAKQAHIVLYATPGSNAVYERLKQKLPLVVDRHDIKLGQKAFNILSAGTKFIAPNPEAPERYVMVQGGLTTDAVAAGNNLPDFLPDYVVYDARAFKSRSRLIASKPYLKQGYFDKEWRVPANGNEGADDTPSDENQGAQANTQSVTSDDASFASDRSLTAGAGVAAKPKKIVPYNSRLPVPKPPPVPPRPGAFLAPANDPAGRAAREMVQRVSTFYNFRADTPGAEWYFDTSALWSVRPEHQCLESLKAANIPFERVPDDEKVSWKKFYAPIATPVPTPVRITGPVDNITFRSVHPGRPIILACEFAAKLPKLVEVLKRYDIWMLDVISSYRPAPFTSFHTFGFAMDISAFYTQKEEWNVRRDFVVTPNNLTCHEDSRHGPLSKTPRDKILKKLACDLRDSHLFASILTPNYNEGHRDHFHLDIRPDDPRIFVR